MDKKQEAYLSDILTANDKLRNYFTLLLNFSKTYYNDKEGFQTCSIGELAEVIHQEMSFIIRDNAKFMFEVNIDKEFEIDVNINNLLRALANVINNGLQYSKAENKIISITMSMVKSKLKIAVWNNGSSFSPDLLENSSKLFYRGDKSRNLASENYGIGLAFVKRVAETHGGYLEISNRADGAEVSLFIGLNI